MEKIEIQIARKFHKVYEKLAPEFGYTTRPETREFDENSSNGKLMIAVCKEVVLEELDKAREGGYKKGWEDQQHLDGLLYVTTVATTTTLEEGWKLKDPKELKKELSKLTTK